MLPRPPLIEEWTRGTTAARHPEKPGAGRRIGRCLADYHQHSEHECGDSGTEAKQHDGRFDADEDRHDTLAFFIIATRYSSSALNNGTRSNLLFMPMRVSLRRNFFVSSAAAYRWTCFAETPICRATVACEGNGLSSSHLYCIKCRTLPM